MERFWSKVNKTEGCWLWTAFIHPQGYGRFRFRGRVDGAHRVSYILVKGEIPEGLWIDHLCRNRACVNPDHLEAVSPQENVLRGIGLPAVNAQKTHCSKGHPFSGDNLYETKEGRRCKICIKQRFSKYYKKNQGKILAQKREKYWKLLGIKGAKS